MTTKESENWKVDLGGSLAVWIMNTELVKLNVGVLNHIACMEQRFYCQGSMQDIPSVIVFIIQFYKGSQWKTIK